MKVTIYASAEKVPDWSSWLIMNWMKTPYSHVFIVYKSRMYHAVDRGVCDDNFDEFALTHHLAESFTFEAPITEERFLKWYESYKGIKYSDAQFAGFISKIFRPLVRNKRKGAVCSEFVSWFLFDVMGWEEFKDADFKSPKDVIDAIKERLNGGTKT